MIDIKDIMNEWQVQFPILSSYTPRTLFAKAGIVLMGLRAVLHLIDSAPFWGLWSMCGKLELELALACYFKNENLIGQVKKEIEETVRETSQWSNVPGGHQSMEEWKKDLYRRMEDREAFMRQVEQNLNGKRISGFKPIHISDDVGDADLSEPVNIQDDLEQLKPLLQKIKRFFGFR